ncbi:FmdB family transcriptional regulator [candidate division KSB3 bacterium]|uniref:FmdB family transcriptional regulator n=1 Tax=candidate division KSB3 bacterium TaxID=2044937 RepID=A0A2G6KK78_9BACT|nr:MAG: FmdB family transcriptional regulator [candidate division KSB3 bacterium]
MPIFEYTCVQCGNEFEKLITNRSVPVDCPACQGHDVKKKFSVFGMKSGGNFVSSSGSSSCGSCTSHSCASCQQ